MRARPASAVMDNAGRYRSRLGATEPAGVRAARALVDADVGEVQRCAVDSGRRRRDPAGELARLVDGPHDLRHPVPIGGAGQPGVAVPLPFGLGDEFAVRGNMRARVAADPAVEALVRQEQPVTEPGFCEGTGPQLY